MNHFKGKPDIAKIIICGIPFLLIIWATAFLLLGYFTRNIGITKYGAFIFFLISIPSYFYLAKKNATRLNATIDEEDEQIRKGNVDEIGKKKLVTNRHLIAAGLVVTIAPTYLYIGQLQFGLTPETLKRHLYIALFIVFVVETVIFKLKRKK